MQTSTEESKAPRLLLLALHLQPGGVERALCQQANAFAKRGWQVEIFSSYRVDRLAYPLDEGVRLRQLSTDWPNRQEWKAALAGRRWLSLLRESGRALGILWRRHFRLKQALEAEKERAEVVIFSRSEQLLALPRRFGYRCLLQLHQDQLGDGRLLRHLRQKGQKLAALLCLMPQQEAEMRSFFARLKQKQPSPKICTLAHFVEAEEAVAPEGQPLLSQPQSQPLPITEKEKCWLFVGRLEEVKQPLLALSWFERFLQLLPSEERCDWRLCFCGDGSLRPTLEQEIAQKGLAPQVRLLGNLSLDQLKQQMRKAQGLLLPSRSEGFGFVILEAIQQYLPVFALDVRLSPKVLIRPGLGYVLPAERAEEMPKQMQQAAQLWTQRGQWSQDALIRRRELLEEYSEEAQMQKWEALLKELGVQAAQKGGDSR